MGIQDPNNRALGPKYNYIWALKPYYLGPWTLRAGQSPMSFYAWKVVKMVNMLRGHH